MAESKRNGILSRLLVSDAVIFQPKAVTEIVGRNILSVQGLRDILQFTPRETRLLTDSGEICVIGDALAVTILTQDSIELKGDIRSVIFVRDETECGK